ncbi:ribonuclease P protein component [Candidatus Parcubacteria bacterium]|nr:MAG: ribonuclease P protein component [Candidatus Parcubacteria bacterium]
MFAQKNRISKQRDFDKIFKKGKTIKNGFFKIFILSNNLKYNRYSIIISKKVSKSAFIRNKIKRTIRKEILNFNLNNHGKDILINTYPTIHTDKDEIKREINNILKNV